MLLSQQLALEFLSGKELEGAGDTWGYGSSQEQEEGIVGLLIQVEREAAAKVVVVMKTEIREARKVRVWVTCRINLREEMLKVLIPTTKMVTVWGDGC